MAARFIGRAWWLAVGVLVASFLAASPRADRGSREGGLEPCPTINQVQSLSSLVTAQVQVADVVETELHGFTGSTRTALIVRGDFLLGVDLSRAKFEVLDPAGKSAVVSLPPPTSRSPRVDHARSRVFAVYRDGLWQLIPGERADGVALNAAFRDAQRLVENASRDPALLDKSRRQAEQVVTAFFQGVGWHVTVRWDEGERTTGTARPAPRPSSS